VGSDGGKKVPWEGDKTEGVGRKGRPPGKNEESVRMGSLPKSAQSKALKSGIRMETISKNTEYFRK